MNQEIKSTVPQLVYRKDITLEIVNAVQRAKEIQRLSTDPRSLKTKRKDVVDELIALGAQHITISCLLKKHGLKMPSQQKK
jgi:hypothetical protein